MMAGRPNYILLPVSPLFIAFSLTCAFMLNLLPWGHWVGVPDFVALTVVFWGIHQPRKVGIGVAFSMGLLMDVHDATLLGENALAYTLLSGHTRQADLDVAFRMIKAEMEAGRGVEAVLDLVRAHEKVVSAALGPHQSKAFVDRVSQILGR